MGHERYESVNKNRDLFANCKDRKILIDLIFYSNRQQQLVLRALL